MNRSRVSRIALLVALAGTATPVLAQDDPSSVPGHDPVRGDRLTQLDLDRDRVWQPGDDRDTGAQARQGASFESCRALDQRQVVNPQGEQVGTLTDFIIDRGSGKIDYGVVKTGAVLGLGGKKVVLPYDQFQWSPRHEALMLQVKDKEELKTHPEFSPEEWEKAMARGDGQSPLRERLDRDSGMSRDPYEGRLENAKDTRIEGEIVAVNRDKVGAIDADNPRDRDDRDHHEQKDKDRNDNELKNKDLEHKDAKDADDTEQRANRNRGSGENVWLTIRADDGRLRRVVLGPSWYVSSGAVAPMRGQQVIVEGVAPDSDPDRPIVARSITIDGKEMVLRTEKHAPLWLSPQEGELSGNQRRYLLLSTITGAPVDARGVKCGTVHDVIIERQSGEIAFLSIDPDRNFLGIADTRRLVPWEVATVFVDGDVHVDANREMVLASPETPNDLTTLGRAEQVYRAFGIEAPDFTVTSRSGAGMGRWRPVYANLDPASKTTVSGTVLDVSDVHINNDLASARIMKVQTADGEQLVLLGPAGMIGKDVPDQRDESVVIEAYRTSINGKPYLVARTINVDGRQITLLDTTGSNNILDDDR